LLVFMYRFRAKPMPSTKTKYSSMMSQSIVVKSTVFSPQSAGTYALFFPALKKSLAALATLRGRTLKTQGNSSRRIRNVQ